MRITEIFGRSLAYSITMSKVPVLIENAGVEELELGPLPRFSLCFHR